MTDQAISALFSAMTDNDELAAAVLATVGPASGIVCTPVGGVSANNVQAAIQELDTEKATVVSVTNHTGAATGAHAASAIAVTPVGAISATTVQAALAALDARLTAGSL